MTFTYVDGEDFYAVDLDEAESAAYEQGEDGRADLETQIQEECISRGIEEWLTVYHVQGHKLFDVPHA